MKEAREPCVEHIVPDPVALSEFWDNPPLLTPPVIDGVLRQGHKMMLSGPSKAGKTFSLMELALSVATGESWMGLNCKKGVVLYINLELDEKSCFNRFKKIGQARGINDVSGVRIWNLRGYNVPFEDLAPYIASMVKQDKLSMVIIDPIYKLFTGSENNQEIVADFCRKLDVIAKAGASVVYCHHHSKGTQANKDSMDRASGSGVFARDADALIDMVQLVPGRDTDLELEENGITAWLVSFTLREFKSRKPLKVLFDYPLHTVCNDGSLDNAVVKGSYQNGGKKRGEQQSAEKALRVAKFESAYQTWIEKNGKNPNVKDMVDVTGFTEKSVRRYAKDLKYEVILGVIYKSDSKDKRTSVLLSLLSDEEMEVVNNGQ